MSSVETIELSLQADTVEYVIVENKEGDITYFKVTNHGLIPEVKLVESHGNGFIIILLLILASSLVWVVMTDNY